jgi:hypothetical protein
VISWFGRHGDGAEFPRARGRASAALPIDRVSIEALRPEPIAVLGQAAYLQLALFEALGRAASASSALPAKAALSASAGLVLAKHRALSDELRRRGADPATAMAPHRLATDAFIEKVAGADWYEALTSIYLTTGLLDDFFARLASGIPDTGERVAAIISGDNGMAAIVDLLSEGIAATPTLASRLAVWGRRLVGDTLLLARSALPAGPAPKERRIEPILTELMAEHTRRMDRLGLTA